MEGAIYLSNKRMEGATYFINMKVDKPTYFIVPIKHCFPAFKISYVQYLLTEKRWQQTENISDSYDGVHMCHN